MNTFPKDFSWGVSTASYQIEGGSEDRGPSIWDMFCRKPGAVFDGHNGDVACDHYHRYLEDVRLMHELGVGAYRLSISWPRILDEGVGAPLEKGLAFYDRLVDALLEHEIEPWLTLFHWDLPLALYHRGGWLNPDVQHWFADYTAILVDRLSDRVRHWMTQNEPQCFIGLGMWEGIHAPGDKLRWSEILLAAHHSLLAHGRSVTAIRAAAKQSPKIGIAPACQVFLPVDDVEVARARTFFAASRSGWNLSWWLDPIFLGRYPEDGVALFGDEMPSIGPDDFDIITQPIDFLGMNMYHGRYVRATSNGHAEIIASPTGSPVTALKWPVTPECLYWGPKFYYERYRVPIVVTENGLSNPDWVAADGQVHDPQRIDYLHRHLRELHRAVQDGVPVEGYFQWSLLDNFEWAEGYRERFGLIFVDYANQKRIPKDSYYWYKDIVAGNGEALFQHSMVKV